MSKLKKILNSKSSSIILSIILGLGLASIFKMSCDSRSCMVYQAADLEDKNIIKYNDKCYEAKEKIENCDNTKRIIDI
jgi:hypothetical protein